MSDQRETARQWPPGHGRLIVVSTSMRAAEAWATGQGLDAGTWVGVHSTADVTRHVQVEDVEFVIVYGAGRGEQARVAPMIETLTRQGKQRRE